MKFLISTFDYANDAAGRRTAIARGGAAMGALADGFFASGDYRAARKRYRAASRLFGDRAGGDEADLGEALSLAAAGKAGLVDGDCRFVLPCRYEDVGGFAEGVVPAKLGGKWGFTMLTGKWAMPRGQARVNTGASQ